MALGVPICEDIWTQEVTDALAQTGAEILCVPNGSPFEAGKEDVDRGAGVITDPQIHARVITNLESFVATDLPTLAWRGVTESPLRGPAGNKEFLAYLERIT